ncbi:META domain-containing protein [Verrucomicrobia bacterium S94]|nr:META domain-containing protein [Verrucomicrobia bacterium S94]
MSVESSCSGTLLTVLERMMNRWAVLACFLGVMLSVSCKTPVQEVPQIEGIAWELSGISDSEGNLIPPVQNAQVWFKLSEGRITGNAGANRFFGEYVLSGRTIRFSLTGSGMMMGTPELMAQEMRLLKVLGETVDYRIIDGELRLRNADQDVMVTMKRRVEPPLFSTVWKVTGVNNGKGGMTGLLTGSEITLEFTQDGAVSGSAGCNVFNGSYVLNGETIRFSSLATTRRMCFQPEGVMEQEAVFLQALEHSKSCNIKMGVLELRDESGGLQVKGVVK